MMTVRCIYYRLGIYTYLYYKYLTKGPMCRLHKSRYILMWMRTDRVQDICDQQQVTIILPVKYNLTVPLVRCRMDLEFNQQVLFDLLKGDTFELIMLDTYCAIIIKL